MKQNFYNDPNKLLNQPGRKFHNSETSYYTGSRDWANQADSGPGQASRDTGFGGRPRGRGRGDSMGRGGGPSRGGYRNNKEYVDWDDPNENAKNLKKKDDDRDLVDYSDLFS